VLARCGCQERLVVRRRGVGGDDDGDLAGDLRGEQFGNGREGI
jgi:hypothetical protein